MAALKSNYRPWFKIGDNGGQWDIARQDAGLAEIDFKDKTVLEVGCAEGLVSLQNLKRGARISHGIEFRERAVEVAKSIAGVLGLSETAKFYCGDIRDTPAVLNQPGMLERYDIIIAMAVLQKVANQPEVLGKILQKCSKTFVLRMPVRKLYKYRLFRWRYSWGVVDPVDIARQNGFRLLWESCGYPQGKPPFPKTGEAWLGVFERE
jgi:2-polyprenyl-3-methyl-5-hydroxy-6-metoxy-1,4-benzoquinol methylase